MHKCGGGLGAVCSLLRPGFMEKCGTWGLQRRLDGVTLGRAFNDRLQRAGAPETDVAQWKVVDQRRASVRSVKKP